eukprot:2360800-Ditylum_brightwellii.AAC.1
METTIASWDASWGKTGVTQVNTLDSEKLTSVEKDVTLLSDTLVALKDHKSSDNMVNEMGGLIFRGKKDALDWMEAHLSATYLFGVFVDI